MANAFVDALEMVKHARTGKVLERKKVANNTWARPVEHVLDGTTAVAVRLHQTDVVTIHADGRVRLDSGGWRTVTTKERINRFAPGARVWSVGGRWVLLVGRETVPYYDGVEYDAEQGRVLVDPARVDVEAARDVATRLLKERVTGFVRLLEQPELARPFVAAVVEGGSWAGDCWYCLMRDENGVPLGDASGSHGHLEDHLEEGYLVPSLFRNAFREQYGDEKGDQALWVYAVDVQNGYARGERRAVNRVMSRYFVKRLIEGGK
jgi:hypothetical protein